MNDMSGLTDNTILLYADDSAILAVDKDISTVGFASNRSSDRK